MLTYLFTDLDDTLFQTLRKCEGRDFVEGGSLMPGAIGVDGNPLSFLLPRQQALFSLCSRHMRIVPVTARNSDSFHRVSLCFEHGAILNYGGTLLTASGNEDQEWREMVMGRLGEFTDFLEEAFTFIEETVRRHSLQSRVRFIRDPRNGKPFYVLVKNPDKRAEQLDVIHQDLVDGFQSELPWRLHHNGNNLAVLPGCLDKKHAVAFYIERFIVPQSEPYLLMGMGDSIEDLGFMNLCDYAIVPRGSQVAKERLEARTQE